jgi:hypothetical protein
VPLSGLWTLLPWNFVAGQLLSTVNGIFSS